MSNQPQPAAFTPRPSGDSAPEASELDNLDFQIEAAEYDIKQKGYAVNHAMGQAKSADENGAPELAELWRWRARQNGDEVTALKTGLRDAKSARTRLTRGGGEG